MKTSYMYSDRSGRQPGGFSRFQRVTALVMLVVVTGCSTMQPVSTPKPFLETSQPRVIWVTRQASPTMITVTGPRLMGDTIVGFVEGEYTELPLVEVKSVQAKQYSRPRTAAFLVGLTAVSVAVALLMTGGQGEHLQDDGENEIGIIRHQLKKSF